MADKNERPTLPKEGELPLSNTTAEDYALSIASGKAPFNAVTPTKWTVELKRTMEHLREMFKFTPDTTMTLTISNPTVEDLVTFQGQASTYDGDKTLSGGDYNVVLDIGYYNELTRRIQYLKAMASRERWDAAHRPDEIEAGYEISLDQDSSEPITVAAD